MNKVVVLGGYGNFGKRIVESLAKIESITVFVAGRSLTKAQTYIDTLDASEDKLFVADLQPLVIDIFAEDFTEQLSLISPYLVIHTGGPFQGQDYRVPKACIKLKAHYIDLADDRRFVCDISKLDTAAKHQGVVIISGASSVPGLSSAVVEQYQGQFSVLDTIDMAIAPGNKAERGQATVTGILSYTGHGFNVFRDGRWQDAYGWMDSKVTDFGGIVGKRFLANVDVPDLELFPNYYHTSERVSFQAGLELSFLHKTMVIMARLVKIGLVKNWSPMAKIISKSSDLFLPLGSDNGAMQVLITGTGIDGKALSLKWVLYAPNGNGPYIPTLSAIILARKLLQSNELPSGATPCIGLLDLNCFSGYFKALGIYSTEQKMEV
jgi:saccharopine dehydrogenase-like NADP-dependent oxidoreductase